MDVDAPLQTNTAIGCVMTGVGFIIIVKVFAVPVQVAVPFTKTGVAVMVAVIGALPLLVAEKTFFVSNYLFLCRQKN